MSLQVLVTGAAGFIGTRLMSSLSESGARPEASCADLLDWEALSREVSARPWDAIVHLAAISHVPTCEKNPDAAYRVNVAGTALLLEAIRRGKARPHLVFASTAQVYAGPSGPGDVVLDERSPIEPQSLYARTKWQAELLIRDDAGRARYPATILRLFNHSHKSQSPDFFLPHLYSRMIECRDRGLPGAAELPVGNLDLRRDIGAVQDLIGAFGAVIQSPPPVGEVRLLNVCSGAGKSLRRLAEGMAARLGVEVVFRTEPQRVRPGEPSSIVGSNRGIREALGWSPRCVSEADLLDAFFRD